MPCEKRGASELSGQRQQMMRLSRNMKNDKVKRMINQLFFWLTTYRKCAWCRETLHTPLLALFWGDCKTSHGVCRECAQKFLEPSDLEELKKISK